MHYMRHNTTSNEKTPHTADKRYFDYNTNDITFTLLPKMNFIKYLVLWEGLLRCGLS
jgi:hypothetical protein